MKNAIDKSLDLARIQKEKRNAVANGCRDVAIILRHPKFKKSQRINTFHTERKKVYKPMIVLENTRKDKIKSISFRPLVKSILSRWRHYCF